MQFVDLKTQYANLKEPIQARINVVLEHGQYSMGPEVGELELRLAEFVEVRHCVSVSSGTDALLVAMMALGIGRGDEVITTPFTFIATGEMIALLGAIPIFVDIDPITYNIDHALIESAITAQTKAIMPVNLYGQCAAFDEINAIVEKHKVPVIEDAAQSFGATYRGKTSCALSTIGCTSFFPSKLLGCYGDGGACFTDNEELAKRIREIRDHGQQRRYHHTAIGLNRRLDTLQAAILLAKLDVFPAEVAARARIGACYSDRIASKCRSLVVPQIASDNTSVFAQYTVQSDARERLLEKLKANNVPSAVHYPVPLHRQPVFAGLETTPGGRTLSVAESAAERVFSLPMHPYLSVDDIEHVVEILTQGLQ